MQIASFVAFSALVTAYGVFQYFQLVALGLGFLVAIPVICGVFLLWYIGAAFKLYREFGNLEIDFR